MTGATASLQSVPVALFHAMDEQTDGLLREYTLATLGTGDHPFSAADVTAAGAAKAMVSAAVQAAVAAAAGDGDPPRSVAVTVALTPDALAGAGLLQGVLDHANRLALVGELLSLPALPEVAALRNWICDQLIGQAAGAEPSAWQMPTGLLEQPGVPLAVWEQMGSLPADEAWLAGDDSNRIIGASPAALALLGWDEAELVGQRIIAVIPPELRELHVAAFTRGVVTGTHRLLDAPLELSAHTRDGRNLPVTLTLHRHSARGDRAVYLARLQPR
ncbi:MAG: PAS domain-containing protein [Actinomycetes bacterium]